MISGLALARSEARISSLWASSRAQMRLLADVDAVKRRLGDVDVALADQLRHVAEEERQQQRGDVVAVGVGVHEQNDFAVAQAGDVELLAGAGADGRDQVGQLGVGQHLDRAPAPRS